MTIDPDTPRTTEVRTSYDPAGPTATEVRRTEVRPNRTGWWVGGLVALAAIAAVTFMVTRNTAPAANDQAVAAAADQGRAQGAAETAQSDAALAQANAQAATQNAQGSALADADRAAAARQRAETAADRAAATADESARDAAASAAPRDRDRDAPPQ